MHRRMTTVFHLDPARRLGHTDQREFRISHEAEDGEKYFGEIPKFLGM
jgi:hypothetical protein